MPYNQTKAESMEIIEDLLQGRDAAFMAKLVYEWMGSNELQEFAEYVEKETEY